MRDQAAEVCYPPNSERVGPANEGFSLVRPTHSETSVNVCTHCGHRNCEPNVGTGSSTPPQESTRSLRKIGVNNKKMSESQTKAGNQEKL